MEEIHIYRIYFPSSGKCYIGQTSNLKRRMMQHITGKFNSLVQKALMKHEGWKVSVLHTCTSRDEANRIEIEEIRNFGSVAPNGYNLTHGGDAETPSELTKAKMRIVANKPDVVAKKRAASVGENNPMYGRLGDQSPGFGCNNPMKNPEILAKVSGKNAHLFGKKGAQHPAYSRKRPDVAKRNRVTAILRRYKEYQQKIRDLEAAI